MKLERKTRQQLLEMRIRELLRAIRKTKDKGTREIYKSHLEFLRSQI